MPTMTVHHDPDVADEIAALCQEATIETPAPGITVATFDTLDDLNTVAAVVATAMGRTVTTLEVAR